MLQGHVEIDEAYVGGRRPGKRGRGAAGKTIVMGMKERGGRIVAEVIPDVKQATLRDVVLRTVEARFDRLDRRTGELRLTEGRRIQARRVRHGDKEWSYYDYRHWRDSLDQPRRSRFGSCSRLRCARRTFTCRAKYMDRYLGEFAFRSNHRADAERDVRSSDLGFNELRRGGFIDLAKSAGPTPRASSCSTNSVRRLVSNAFLSVRLEVIRNSSFIYSRLVANVAISPSLKTGLPAGSSGASAPRR